MGRQGYATLSTHFGTVICDVAVTESNAGRSWTFEMSWLLRKLKMLKIDRDIAVLKNGRFPIDAMLNMSSTKHFVEFQDAIRARLAVGSQIGVRIPLSGQGAASQVWVWVPKRGV